MPNPELNLSVIIVNWNTRDLLAQCLGSVYANPPAGELEVIVVDNGSTDGSGRMVSSQYPNTFLIQNERNLGFARANNQALKIASGRYALLLNSDALLTDGALTQMITFLEAHPTAGALAPKLVNPDGSFQASFASFPSLWSEMLSMTGLARHVIGPYAPSPKPQPDEFPSVVDWVSGASFMIRRDASNSVGLLDENYFFYGEEMDWCWRLRQAGWEVWYLPSVEVVHIGGASSKKISIDSYLHLYDGKIKFFERAYGYRAAAALRVMISMITLLRLIARTIMMPVLLLKSGSTASLRLRQDIALLNNTVRFE